MKKDVVILIILIIITLAIIIMRCGRKAENPTDSELYHLVFYLNNSDGADNLMEREFFFEKNGEKYELHFTCFMQHSKSIVTEEKTFREDEYTIKGNKITVVDYDLTDYNTKTKTFKDYKLFMTYKDDKLVVTSSNKKCGEKYVGTYKLKK